MIISPNAPQYAPTTFPRWNFSSSLFLFLFDQHDDHLCLLRPSATLAGDLIITCAVCANYAAKLVKTASRIRPVERSRALPTVPHAPHASTINCECMLDELFLLAHLLLSEQFVAADVGRYCYCRVTLSAISWDFFQSRWIVRFYLLDKERQILSLQKEKSDQRWKEKRQGRVNGKNAKLNTNPQTHLSVLS